MKGLISEYIKLGDKEQIDLGASMQTPLSVKDIILLPFTANIMNIKETYSEERSLTLKRMDERRINAYLSTPRFIKYLTDISELISKEVDK